MLLLPCFMSAQVTWDLNQCVKHAIEHNTSLKLKKLELGLSEINLQESKWRRLPNINANINSGINFGRNIDPISNDFITDNYLSMGYGLSTQAVVYQGGAIHNTIKLNERNKEASQLEYIQNANDISLLVANSYLQTLLSEERIRVAHNNVESIRLQLKQMQSLIKAGGKAEADALEIESQLARIEQAELAATNAYELNKAQLKQLIKLDSKSDIILQKISDDILDKIKLESYTYDQLYDQASSTQAGIQAAKIRLQSARLSEKIARSAFYPSIYVSGSFGSRYSDLAVEPTTYEFKKTSLPGILIDGKSVIFEQLSPSVTGTKVRSFSDQFDQFLGYGLGIAVNLPIYNNHATRANLARAKIQTESNQLILEQKKETLQQDITQSMLSVKAAIKEYEASQKSYNTTLAASQKTKKRFDIGSTSSFEMNVSQTNLLNAELNLLIAKYDLLFKQKVLDYYAGKKIN